MIKILGRHIYKTAGYIIIYLLLASLLQAQTPKADSLIRLLPSLSQDTNRVNVLNEIAWQIRSIDPERAMRFANEGVGLARSLNYLAGISYGLRSVGSTYHSQGDYPEALRCYYEGLAIEEKRGSEKGMAFMYNNLGYTYYFQRNYPISKKYYLQAIQIRQKVKDMDGLGFSYNGLGLVFHKLKQLDSAQYYLEQALQIRKKLNTPAQIAGTLSNLSGLFITKNVYDKAQVYATEALALFKKTGHKMGEVDALLHLTRIHLKKRQLDAAISIGKECLTLSQKVSAKYFMQEILQTFAEIYAESGDYAQAFNYYRRSIVYKDSIYNAERDREFIRLQLIRKEAENKTLQANNLMNKAKVAEHEDTIRRQSALILSIIAGLLIVIGLLFILFRTNRQIRQANETIQQREIALAESNRFKDKLFAVVSHDFRSPLNSLQGTLFLLQQGMLSEAEISKIVENLSEKVGNTLNLVDNLLYWAKSQMDGIDAKPQSLDLKPIIQENFNLIRPQAEQKQVQLYNRLQEPIKVKADPDMLKMVLRNLLSNAVKFTAAGDTITITVQAPNGKAIIAITDTGQGISPENQAKLFGVQNFTTIGTANELGTGLGLMLCKEFVEKNGGDIWVESQEGQGSTFYFTLPTVA